MSNIQWTDETWNWLVGCSRISLGCANCYAAEAAKSPRLQQFDQYQGIENWDGKVNFVESQLLKPLTWKKPKKIFTCSMSDVFHESVPFEWIDRGFAVMAIASQHTFQVLTKRPERMLEYITDPRTPFRIAEQMDVISKCKQDLPIEFPLKSVWLGVSVENQKVASDRIPLLLQTPAAKRFLSCEPLLEKLDLSEWLGEPIGEEICDACEEIGLVYAINGSPLAGGTICTKCCPRLDWIICGGESGKNSRPTHIDWLRSLVEASKAAKVPVFVKQLGSYPIASSGYIKDVDHTSYKLQLKDRKGGNIDEFPPDLKIRQFP